MGESKVSRISLPNSEQFLLRKCHEEEYLIQVSWPLHWRDSRTNQVADLPIIYIPDGNALFLTATEAAWRRAASSHFSGGGIVVAIGYPLHNKGKLYDSARRSFDLTPPTPGAPVPGYGGAEVFLDFIEDKVRPFIKTMFPKVTVTREALYGHSYGGLLALHALFTRPEAFDCYIASSPSIWWNSKCILKEANKFLNDDRTTNLAETKTDNASLPTVMIFWGSWEEHPPRWNDEPLDSYEGRKQVAKDLRMAGNAQELVELLEGSENKVQAVLKKEYEGEEHTSVMACTMGKSLTLFFEDWPLPDL